MSKAHWVTLMPVRNMNRAVRFYRTRLAAKVLYRGTGPMKDFWSSLRVAGAEVWLIAPEKREKRSLAYTTIVVPSIKTFVRGLQKKGVKFEKPERGGPDTRIEGPIAWESFGASAYFKDSEGNLLMAWQNFPPM